MTGVEAPSLTSTTKVTLPVTGMTCASCVRRIEKALGRIDGVREANANLATEKAHVVFDPARASVEQMRAAIEKAGYAIAAVSEPVAAADGNFMDRPAQVEDVQEIERQREMDDLKRKWTVSLAAGVLMMALMYAPLNAPMDVVAPGLLIIATLVQFWAGRTIYQAA